MLPCYSVVTLPLTAFHPLHSISRLYLNVLSFFGLSPLSPGAIHLQFHSSGNHYVWRKVTSTVHNIIVGKLWIDQVGLLTTSWLFSLLLPCSFLSMSLSYAPLVSSLSDPVCV